MGVFVCFRSPAVWLWLLSALIDALRVGRVFSSLPVACSLPLITTLDVSICLPSVSCSVSICLSSISPIICLHDTCLFPLISPMPGLFLSRYTAHRAILRLPSPPCLIPVTLCIYNAFLDATIRRRFCSPVRYAVGLSPGSFSRGSPLHPSLVLPHLCCLLSVVPTSRDDHAIKMYIATIFMTLSYSSSSSSAYSAATSARPGRSNMRLQH
ncbi:hypothetical protein C8Q80DRAFT_1175420 [Daedaleopsis nitida]|nr:hypothetical protein C8Q80DRAFT_1175420 [Daedaleopsis nitida]